MSVKPAVAAILAVLGVAATAATATAAPPTDIRVKKPNALLLIDTSGSMSGPIGSGSTNCVSGKKARWTILAETLTGTIGDLKCSSSHPVQSNDCRPYLNRNASSLAAYTTSPMAWPVINSGQTHLDDAIVFCGKGGGSSDYNRCSGVSTWSASRVCKEKNGEWEQVDDGLIDSFKKDIRFGLMTFDSLSAVPDYDVWGGGWNDGHADPYKWYRPMGAVPGDASWGEPDYCQAATDGSRCKIDDNYGVYETVWSCCGDDFEGLEEWSYWFLDPANSWLTGGRSGFNSKIFTSGVTSFDNTFYPWIDNVVVETVLTDEAAIDIGARNPNAPPSKGRLIGFGPQEWDVSDPSLIGCGSEDDCTDRHNRMVQKAILGASENLDHWTPLGAMMRDARDFILNDTQTVGVHVPHADDDDPASYSAIASKIGPVNDTYFTGAGQCRATSVIMVTDGNPTNDLLEKASVFANELRTTRSVKTYVIGISLDTAWWSTDGSDGSAVQQNCKTLDATAFNAGNMCEPDSTDPTGRKWKYAEIARANPASGAKASEIEACCELLQTAVEGGTNKPYFPTDQAQLKSELNQVLMNIAGGSLSRTIPVFAAAPATFPGSTNAPGSYFELRSSIEPTANNTMWRGHLERVRYACDSSFVPEIQPVVKAKGDVFDANINGDPAPRKFFTVVPLDDSYDVKDMVGSLRVNAASINSHDNLFNSGGGKFGDYRRFGDTASTGTKDEPVAITDFTDEIDGMTNVPAVEDVFGLTVSEEAPCNAATGTNNLEDCADRMMQWYGGVTNPPGAPTPSRIPTSGKCAGGLCSAMGALYRSSPIIVPPPMPSDGDDQNFGRVRSDGSSSFFQQYSTRPTVVYAQTIDGMLHAFTLTMNDTDGVAPDFDPPEVPEVDSLANNELWSFIPPAVVPSLFPNFNTHARLTDGQLAWANVVFERPYGTNAGTSSVETTNWDYRTVIVGASGASALGAFYYAVDVTNPVEPRFLWQLSYAGNATGGFPNDPLFGVSAPGAAITHIRYLEKDGTQKILAAAVLPGGTSRYSSPTAVRDRKLEAASVNYWDGTNRAPRTKIRDWDDGDASRSLTLVELSTGRILGRLVGSMADNPRDPSDPTNLTKTILDDHVLADERMFDSPITGIPAPYPTGMGAVAERIYVGDADGTLWRVELSSPDPEDWKPRIAFDAYNTGSAGTATLRDARVPRFADPNVFDPLDDSSNDTAAATLGQPIQTAPLLSLDEQGNVVVTFATGDQEAFNSVSDGMINIMASFSDRFIGLGPSGPDFQPFFDASTGVEMAFLDGARVTGPINLFDGQLYFAYFMPDESDPCTFGTGGLCGVRYNSRTTYTPDGVVDLDVDGTEDRCIKFEDGEVVFGISINLVPSCVQTEDSNTDSWLAGQYKSITQSNMGTYRLSYHTGQGGSGKDGATSKSDTRVLPTPKSKTRIRSWVSIVE